ncbi:Uncharacterised protein [Shigella flexneri]|nr:Uncharacterised protein [Shigella sonnei]SRN43838.1 Uncharacterised protein [Shigella flexneri]
MLFSIIVRQMSVRPMFRKVIGMERAEYYLWARFSAMTTVKLTGWKLQAMRLVLPMLQ